MNSPIDGFKSRRSNYQFFNSDSFPSNSNPSPNDTAVVFVTADSGENYITVEGNPGDRTSANLNLWHNGDKLIQDVAARYSNVVVVVHTVGPILMEAWHDLPSVKAILFAHLPGQEAGDSLMDVLFGDVSPSGHLPYTLPKSENDYPASVNLVGYQLGQPQDTHTEGLYIDYRHFNKDSIKPRYAFGHGLSYTSFSFSGASINAVTPLTAVPPTRPAKGATPVYSTAIPPASEAYWPNNFNRIWRYLYSWLEKQDADAAAAAANSSAKYPYPAGYSNTQKPGSAAGGAQVRMFMQMCTCGILTLLLVSREETQPFLMLPTTCQSRSPIQEHELAKPLPSSMYSFLGVLRLILRSSSSAILKRPPRCNRAQVRHSNCESRGRI